MYPWDNPTSQPNYYQAPPPDPGYRPPAKNNTALIIFIAIISVIVFTAILGVSYFMIQSRQETNTQKALLQKEWDALTINDRAMICQIIDEHGPERVYNLVGSDITDELDRQGTIEFMKEAC